VVSAIIDLFSRMSSHQANLPRLAGPRLKKILVYFILAVWSVVCTFPLYWLVITSLKSETEITAGPFYFPFFDFTPSLDGWAFILTDPNDNLLGRFVNSLIVSTTSTMLTLLFGSMVVYGVTRFWKNARVILVAILATRILPPIVVILPVYIMARYTNTLDTRLALIIAYTAANLPVALWLLRPVFGNEATEQEEAAELDGASRLQIFFTVFLPMVAVSVAAVGLLVFVLCWNEWLFATYLASDKAMTLPPWLVGQMSIKEAQVGSEAEELQHFSAATIFMVAPLIASAAIAQKFLGRLASGHR
jgi:multiple sugar transport system permease protein